MLRITKEDSEPTEAALAVVGGVSREEMPKKEEQNERPRPDPNGQVKDAPPVDVESGKLVFGAA